jgi:multisubunit Na+/H+ antiporter MnhF subunit
MNAFELAATILLVGLVPLGIVCARAGVADGVAALQLGGSVVVTILICLSEAAHRTTYFDVPVIAAVAVWISGLVFARFLGRYV